MSTKPNASFVDHVGSLVRPAKLLEAMQASEDQPLPAEQLRKIQDDSIKEAVRQQDELGLPFTTDGEFRRRGWQRGFMEAVGGFTVKTAAYSFKDATGVKNTAPGCYVTQKLTRRRGIATDEFLYLQKLTRQTPKVTLPSPTIFHFGLFDRCVDPSIYPDIEEFFGDLVAIYRSELSALAELGCERVQLDEVGIALLCDPDNRAVVEREGLDPDELLKRYVKLDNDVLVGKPESMSVGMHLCRGNQAGLWAGSGGYDYIAERLFNEIAVDDYLMEYDSERAGSFEPLRFLPKNKKALIGVISTKDPVLEREDALLRRIDDASKYASMAQIGVCPQCGFASSIAKSNKTMNPMTEEIQWRKLELLRRVGERAWA
jgi:5-methyltetrahydropteroyltriglutamate--homocysteine methyltransferase